MADALGIKTEAGLHTFTLSTKEWVEKTNAIGIYVQAGRYEDKVALTFNYKESTKDITLEDIVGSDLDCSHAVDKYK
ncbi:MAG: hypothetical protein R3Y58_10600 [Eubacteriales bacterium]